MSPQPSISKKASVTRPPEGTLLEKYQKWLQEADIPEGFIQEIRRRDKVIRIFPNIDSAYRLVGALYLRTRDERSTGRQYLDKDEYSQWRIDQFNGQDSTEDASPDEQQTTQPSSVLGLKIWRSASLTIFGS